MSETFAIRSVNPNDEVGGSGCVCGDSKQEDCKPPYAVFYATETDSNLSPYVVACARCLASASAACQAFGEDDVADAEVVDEAD